MDNKLAELERRMKALETENMALRRQRGSANSANNEGGRWPTHPAGRKEYGGDNTEDNRRGAPFRNWQGRPAQQPFRQQRIPPPPRQERRDPNGEKEGNPGMDYKKQDARRPPPKCYRCDSGSEANIVNIDNLEICTEGLNKPTYLKGITGKSLRSLGSEVLEIGATVNGKPIREVRTTFEYCHMGEIGFDGILGLPGFRALKLHLSYDGSVRSDYERKEDPTKSAFLSSLQTIEMSPQPPRIPLNKIHTGEDILRAFSHCFCRDIRDMGNGSTITAPKLKMLTSKPVYRRQFPTPNRLVSKVKTLVDELEEVGIIEGSTSLWNSPLFPVVKTDGSVRITMDLRLINEATEFFPFPIPRVEDNLRVFAGAKVFSTLDLTSGFFQIHIPESDRDYFTFSLPWGRYRFTRLPQGAKNSAQVFQWAMNLVLGDLLFKCVRLYIDDVIVYSDPHEQHVADLAAVLERLSKFGLKAKYGKSYLFRDSVEYLGHVIDQNGIKPMWDNVAALRDLKRPHNIKAVRSLLGTVNYYRRFIPNAGEVLAPLSNLLRKGHRFAWGMVEQSAFETVKGILTSEPLLIHPTIGIPFILNTDASGIAVGACLQQEVTSNRFLDTAAYPLPTQQDLFAILAKGKYFSKLDLSSAYLQLEVATSTQPFLTINTHKGLFRFRIMPFGLANAPSYFQSVMDRVLAGIEGVICYIDDVLITTVSVEKHLAVLKTVFLSLEKYNIKLKKDKCKFVQREIEYLCHLIKEDGIRPLDHKLQDLQKAKSPTNISELRSFLGLVNYYGKFNPNLPDLLRPLHELLHKNNCWSWTKECEEAIEKCKSSITSERVLVPYDTTLPLFLATDASQIGIGAVLSHVIGGQERPIMPKIGNSYLINFEITEMGDNSVCLYLRYQVKKTQDHENADLLSRLPVESGETSRLDNIYALSYMEDLPITAEEIRIETQKDEMLSIVKCYGWPERVPDHLRPYFQRKLELTVDGECLLWGMRVIIPSSLRPNLLSCLHETHSGMSKMKSVARSHFWWPNLDNEIEFLVNRCRNCQQVQDGPNRVKWQPWIWAVRPWQRIHIDYANKDNINLLIVVDSHSKWVEAFPMREITSAKTIEQLRRLFSSYGLPEEIVSDNGPQFTERAVKMIKMALDKNKRKPGDAIQNTLSNILLAYRSTPHETTKKTPSELFIGRSLRTRLSIIHPNLESRVKEQQARQMKYDHGFQQDEFGIDYMVWCRNFRGGDRWIPGRIVGRKGSRVYTVLIHGQVKSYHRDQIRKRWENGGDEDRQYGRQREETDIIAPEADMPNRGRSESPPTETARQQRDSGLVDQNDGGISGESSRSPDPET
ncbi:K02A2.6-like, partial [Cordylochernes scorpioides]